MLSQGHKVSIIFDDPPDFEIDGTIGVEVTRISQRYTDDKRGNEESIRFPLFNTVTRILEELSPTATGPLLQVDIECDFSSVVLSPEDRDDNEKQLREALLPYTKTESEAAHDNRRAHFDFEKHYGEMDLLSEHHLCLPCGLCLELNKIHSEGRSGFLMGGVSHTEGTGILCELITAVKYALEDKTDKIKKRRDDFTEWWLVLVDYISYIPVSVLSSNELDALRNSIGVPYPWSRIIVISSTNVQWHCDLYPGESP